MSWKVIDTKVFLLFQILRGDGKATQETREHHFMEFSKHFVKLLNFLENFENFGVIFQHISTHFKTAMSEVCCQGQKN